MKTVLKSVWVDGYKNLIDCQADLDSMSILVGPNNSGKSNFLEIFPFVQQLLFGSDDSRKAIFNMGGTPRGNSSVCHIEGHRNKPISIKLSAENISDNVSTIYEYSLSIKCKDFHLNKNGEYLGFLKEELTYKEKSKPGKATTLFSRDKSELKIRTIKGNFTTHKLDNFTSAFSATRILYKDLLNIDTNFKDAIITTIEIFTSNIISASANEIRGRIGEESTIAYDKDYKTTGFDIIPVIKEINSDKDLFTIFKKTLCSILDLDDAKFVTFKVPEKIKPKDMPDEISWFSLKSHGQNFSQVVEFSDGTLIVIAILAIIFCPSRKNKFIFIEEPENCLHPKALKVLMTFLKSRLDDLQIFITTHSPSLLNQTPPESVIVARVFDDGGTRFDKIHNLNELKKKLRKGYISFGDLLETEFIDDDDEAIF